MKRGFDVGELHRGAPAGDVDAGVEQKGILPITVMAGDYEVTFSGGYTEAYYDAQVEEAAIEGQPEDVRAVYWRHYYDLAERAFKGESILELVGGATGGYLRDGVTSEDVSKAFYYGRMKLNIGDLGNPIHEIPSVAHALQTVVKFR